MSMAEKIDSVIKGELTSLYYVGTLANELGRTPQTIRKWEVAGILPKPIFKDKSGKRLYTMEQINTIVACAEKCHVRQGYSVANTNFKACVHEELAKLNKKYI